MSTDTDQQLIDLSLNGNMNAFAKLVEKYKHMVYTVAFRMVKRREEAEEVAQDTFLNAYNNLSKFKKRSKFSTWLYRIVYNKSLDYLKSNKNRSTLELDAIEKYVGPTDESFFENIDREERKEIIKGALNKLSSKDNALVVFFYFEELSLREISKITGLKENAIKVRLFRCRQQLAAILSERLAPETIKCYEGRR